MIQKKLCLIGTSAVGKTSLVGRYVHSVFSEKYLTTVGVKIDQKRVSLESGDVSLVIWDLEGDDEFQGLRLSHLRGASAFLLVADSTRPATLQQAIELQQRVVAAVGAIPFMLALNKVDLESQWALDVHELDRLSAQGWSMVKTSARTGMGVEAAFLELARRTLQPVPPS